MPPIAELIQQGSSNLWLFIPTAILIGALHGLEPGHSKTLMAAFIVAIKGTPGQAALLGLCAALSQSIVVWLIAALALTFGNALLAEQAEPYLLLFSSLIVVGVGLWMVHRTRLDNQAAKAFAMGQHQPPHDHDHDHDHANPAEYQDAHERAHAKDIAQNFQGQPITNVQIALFGVTGGLVPCPASVTILLICLNLKQFSLGAVMVASFSFSFGLALSLVSVGLAAAWGAAHIGRRGAKFGDWARRAPYLSGGLMVLVGSFMGVQSAVRIAAA
ncbi:MAG: nickel/cobalt efflux transporter RcnA [Betaproteobacteria bacterium]|nr:nickel/cobalt efflux transporter RcnA [Betaproteobacteria bacterium]